MDSGFSWSGKFSTPEAQRKFVSAVPLPPEKKTTKTEQELCDELFALGDMLSCHIFSMEGEILGTNFGDIPVDDELRESFGQIAANVWSGIRRGEAVGGTFLLATIVFERFKIVGIPFVASGVGILALVEERVDAMYVKDRIVEFVRYWNSINRLRMRVKDSQH